MLRITRRVGERVIVGGDVIVEVVEIRGGSVRLGIEAPRSVPLYREELWLEVQRAAGISSEAVAGPSAEVPALPDGLRDTVDVE